MKQAFYKKILSYLFDIPIVSLDSEYNQSLDLVLSHGRYQLLTQGAIYSYEDKYDNFRLSFLNLKIDQLPIENVLLLGMGMASIPVILEKIFHKTYHYTGIEIDDAVIYLASKYILDDLKSNVEIIQSDAYYYMFQNQNTYDLICMDVFIDDKIPSQFQTRDFLLQIQQALSPNGLLLFNWLDVNKEDTAISNQYFSDTFKKIFPNGKIIQLANNRMMINH